MKLYNSLSRQVEEIKPYQDNKLGFYACGFTVYDYAHLGHLRRYSLDDVLIRILRHEGFEVKFVQNVTDVGHLASDADSGEDKLEKGAKKYGGTAWEVAKKFTDYFFYSMDEMGNLRPDVSCLATEHIAEQIELVKKLETKGYTYVIKDDGVYFDTSKLADYGYLSPQEIKALKAGARVEKVAGKRHVTDFALWKFERSGENRAMIWESPWARRGFPGWHIECSAMSMKYLGEQFEIHTGGKDHLMIHHPNEIAQSEAATGKKPFVKYWVHHNFIQIEGQKMSKSLNNFFTIDDVKKRGFHPRSLRLLFLSAHYRREMNFTWENLAGAQRRYQKLINLILNLKHHEDKMDKNETDKNSTNGDQYRQRFFELMENDLKTPAALVVLWEVSKANLLDGVKLKLLLEFSHVLGLGLERAAEIRRELGRVELHPDELSIEVKQLLRQRQQARDKQDFVRADKLRQTLKSLAIMVEDTPQGQKIRSLE